MEDRAGPDVPTPISDGTYFYILNDFGQISCFNAETGTNIWGPKETGIGRVSSSPLLADGKLYLVSETAEVAVVQAGPKYKLLGASSLDGSYTLSSPLPPESKSSSALANTSTASARVNQNVARAKRRRYGV